MFSKIIEGDYLYIDQAEIARSPIEQLSTAIPDLARTP